MAELKKIRNRWRHGVARFDHPTLEFHFGARDGCLPLACVLDPEVGTETVLYIRDQTEFMRELKMIKPFDLMMKSGIGQTDFGLLAWFLFWVPSPLKTGLPIAMWDLYFNPANSEHWQLWGRLAMQTHWHVFLIGASGEQEGFFEFENVYPVETTLGLVQKLSRDVVQLDFDRTKETFLQEHSMLDLFEMK